MALFCKEHNNWKFLYIFAKRFILCLCILAIMHWPIPKKHSTIIGKTAIWKSRHRHLGIGISIDVGIGIYIANNLFCLAKSLFLPFEVLYEENIHCEVLFKYTCWPSCLEQLYCRKPLASASEERNSTLDFISGFLKTRKAESCILQVYKFLIRIPIRDHFLEIFCKF